jgi:hypothetical protein
MIGVDPSYGLYGTAVVVGHDQQGLRDVPDRLVNRFVSPERDQETTSVRTDDLRHVINVASDIEDVTPDKQSALDRIRGVIRERNEDGMFRIPWFKGSSQTEHNASSNWERKSVEGKTVYYRTQGEAVVWKDRGLWKVDYAVDPQSPTIHAELGRTGSADQALHWADMTIMNARMELHQSYEDVRNVVNLAKEVEDRTPQEQASIDRLQEAIEQGPPPGALDPADDWLETFEQETQSENKRKAATIESVASSVLGSAARPYPIESISMSWNRLSGNVDQRTTPRRLCGRRPSSP